MTVSARKMSSNQVILSMLSAWSKSRLSLYECCSIYDLLKLVMYWWGARTRSYQAGDVFVLSQKRGLESILDTHNFSPTGIRCIRQWNHPTWMILLSLANLIVLLSIYSPCNRQSCRRITKTMEDSYHFVSLAIMVSYTCFDLAQLGDMYWVCWVQYDLMLLLTIIKTLELFRLFRPYRYSRRRLCCFSYLS